MKGDIVVFATGRDPDVCVAIMPSEAAARREVYARAERALAEGWEIVEQSPEPKAGGLHPDPELVVVERGGELDTFAYYLFESERLQRRMKGFLVGAFLRRDLRPV